jgi:hypothetical protein
LGEWVCVVLAQWIGAGRVSMGGQRLGRRNEWRMRRAVKDLGAEGELWELGRVTE